MNEMTHSLNPFRMQEATTGLAVFQGPTQHEITGVRESRAKSLAGVMIEINKNNRWEERAWGLIAATGLVVVALSLWI